MSRAFVNEDANPEPEPTYVLPEPDSQHFDRAAAHAMIEGANAGNTRSAEAATGYAWGDPALLPEMERILADAETRDDFRTAQLAGRFLKRAGEILDET